MCEADVRLVVVVEAVAVDCAVERSRGVALSDLRIAKGMQTDF